MRPRIDAVSFAVDEHIWGHRLYDEQLPHLLILEFLGVLGSNLQAPLHPAGPDTVRFKPQRQTRMRALLFNNPYVESIRQRSVSNDEKWRLWTERFAQDCAALGEWNLGYLRARFAEFDDFAKAIELLRSSAFEARSNKRWSSKFVFPFGPDALYEDLRVGNTGASSNDRRFFARGGELLYLMLSRAARGAELGALLKDRLFDSTAPMNRLARALQGEPELAAQDRPIGYLPYASHPRFDIICEDWLAILSRDMPVYDALEHLIANAGLNVLLYFLECAKAEAGDSDPVEIVCEIVSRERTKVRALSGDSFQSNQGLSMRAVRAAVEKIRLTDEWAQAAESSDPNAAAAGLMRTWFQWPPANGSDEDAADSDTGDELVSKLAAAAETRHGEHVGKIHGAWSRALGLTSRRLSRRTRYAPNDKLLKTLVVSVVDDRMQFDDFLALVRERYGLIVGDVEGARLVKTQQVDQEALSDNKDKLEARLVGLGLVRRLSDSCSFVENPFAMEVHA
ncbi:hypothetical protein QN397_23650 [Variovorax sp. RTB1]|uniref:hypothetical protein n=1 Tax=Variovorax sp. RTB1 TaxID=3048631 RepID=UPI002B226013|nr:hypothetical protein [Variovorax sp. RTB1]MEB0114279.1 hypothetical protein [Variovorax sp. RTB1]